MNVNMNITSDPHGDSNSRYGCEDFIIMEDWHHFHHNIMSSVKSKGTVGEWSQSSSTKGGSSSTNSPSVKLKHCSVIMQVYEN